ncbi:MAG TPA: SpoVR family protein [Planctomycetota bacterium]|nr:SpoVR family protein [Planctomycetota bacterium]
MAPLPPHLHAIQNQIRDIALRCKLDFFEVDFQMVDFDQMNRIAAYGGFPTRYPHWRFGMEYERLSKQAEYGLAKIYELVINNNPCYEYVMDSNSLLDHKLVMAHVYAHSDFFKNNMAFAHTNRHMIDEMANHATRIRSYIDYYGAEEVDDFLFRVLSLEDLIDIHAPVHKFAPAAAPSDKVDPISGRSITRRKPKEPLKKLPARDYMDRFINPVNDRSGGGPRQIPLTHNFPEAPVRDVLGFLLEYAPLEPWQTDVIAIVREEMLYFAPQIQTKIMNEGWASYWHSRMMTERIMSDAEIIDFADHHSGTVAMQPGQINPYRVGLEIFRDIEDRWNRGCFGREWEECSDLRLRSQWNKHTNQGREKIYEVRKIFTDVSFIDEFLTPEVVDRSQLFTYRGDPGAERGAVIDSRAFQKVKNKLLRMLTNFGRPYLQVVDGNYHNRGELFMKHSFDGQEIDVNLAKEALKNLASIWTRPAHLATVVGGKGRVVSCDGSNFESRSIDLEGAEKEVLDQLEAEDNMG